MQHKTAVTLSALVLTFGIVVGVNALSEPPVIDPALVTVEKPGPEPEPTQEPTQEPTTEPEPVEEPAPEKADVKEAHVSPEPVVLPPEPEVIHEDDPRWDCRVMGNEQCGVEIEGAWYVIQFEGGAPVAVWQR